MAFACAGALVGLWLVTGPPWPLTLAANLVHVAGAGALVAAPLCWRSGARALAALQLGAVAVVAVALSIRWSHGPSDLRADESSIARRDAPGGASRPRELRLLTYNLGTDLAVGDRLAQGLARSGADVIALQELSHENAALLDGALGERYPHRVLHPAGIPGRGLFSTWPIVASEWIEDTQVRRHLRVELDVDGRALTVWVLHLSMQMSFLGRATDAAADLDRILARAGGDGAVVLCGDFNTTERSADWRRVRAAGFEDAFRAAGRGPGFTFPIGNRYLGIPAPTCVRIDYVWIGRALAARRAWVGPDLGSDHLPVLADLVLGRAAGGSR